MTPFDPDNPNPQEIEELTRKEARRQVGETPEEPLNHEEAGETREVLDSALGADVVAEQAERLSPENGTMKGNIEDRVEEEAIKIKGYDAGSETPGLQGDIVYEEANQGLVAVEYVLSENLVDTTGQIKVPVIDAHVAPQDDDLLSIAYERDEPEIKVRRGKEGNYNVKIVYENPEDLEEGIGEVARFLAEFENELTSAYNQEEIEEEDKEWPTGRVTQALEGKPDTNSYLETERRIRGD